MEEKNITVRQAAIKAPIKSFLEGEFRQEEGAAAGGLILPSSQQAFRLNIIGIILQKEKLGNITTFLVEDGTGKAMIRFFEDFPFLSTLIPGEVVLIVGKPRKYNQERYLAPEIIKKISAIWLKVRAAELGLEKIASEGDYLKGEELQNKKERGGFLEVIEEEVIEEGLPSKKIAQLIRSLDLGGGVRIEEIIEKSSLEETEKLLEKMLERGEIFEMLPGRVKVL